jgi:ADP-dependent NAD(P)H-hydrate dehydratase
MTRHQEITLDYLRTVPLPQPEEGSKEQRGRLMVVAGSVEMPGAALLAGTAALRAGAGKLRIATSRSVAPHLALAMPEARVFGLDETDAGGVARQAADALLKRIKGCQAVLIGPGMVEDAETFALAASLLDATKACGFVLDAAPLSCLSEHADLLRSHAGRVVITPHAGEMAALLDTDIEAVRSDPLAAAQRAAGSLGVVVVMKGATTTIVSPDGSAAIYRQGCVGLATSGSGDVLAGVIAGLLARGARPDQAAAWAVYLHGEAGSRLARSRGPLGFLARELPGEIPKILFDAL